MSCRASGAGAGLLLARPWLMLRHRVTATARGPAGEVSKPATANFKLLPTARKR